MSIKQAMKRIEEQHMVMRWTMWFWFRDGSSMCLEHVPDDIKRDFCDQAKKIKEAKSLRNNVVEQYFLPTTFLFEYQCEDYFREAELTFSHVVRTLLIGHRRAE